MTPEEFKALQNLAETGNVRAMFDLAFAYYDGNGTEQDLKQYFTWIKKAAEAGDADAMLTLALTFTPRIAKFMDKNSKVPQLYFEWIKKAAEHGQKDAMYLLTLAYREGTGTKKDLQQFFYWLRTADQKGSSYASLPARVFAEIPSIENGAVEKIVDQLWALLRRVSMCKDKHLVDPSSVTTVAHFTRYTTIEKMLPIPKEKNQPEEKHTHFRLYNTEYLNDPDEGKALFQFLKEKNKDLYKTLFDGLAEEGFLQLIHDTLSVYTCSFSTATDRLDLWRAYGKDGNGVSIVTPTLAFDEPQLGQDSLLTNIDRPAANLNALRNDPKTSCANKPLPLYKVEYLGKTISKNKPIQPVLDALTDLSQSMKKLLGKDKAKLRKAILIALSDILYLYKHKEYENEKEVRLIDATPIDSPHLHMDERSPGRLFIKTRDIAFQNADSKVVIGPKVKEKVATELNCKFRLASYGLLDNVTVEQSKIHYR